MANAQVHGSLPLAKIYLRDAQVALNVLGEQINPNRALANLEKLALAEEMLVGALEEVRAMKAEAVRG